MPCCAPAFLHLPSSQTDRVLVSMGRGVWYRPLISNIVVLSSCRFIAGIYIKYEAPKDNPNIANSEIGTVKLRNIDINCGIFLRDS